LHPDAGSGAFKRLGVRGGVHLAAKRDIGAGSVGRGRE
jgi:hypothetical protein